jgi:hypothetical protein
VGVAVYATVVPEQTGLAELPIDTLTARFGFTVIARIFDVAGVPVAHVLILEVRTQLITS